LRQPLHRLLRWPGPLTHRQFTVWAEYLTTRFAEPSLTDFYLMQATLHIAAAPGRVWGKDPGFKMSDFRLVADVRDIPLRRAQEGAPGDGLSGPEAAPGIRYPRRATAADVVKVQLAATLYRLGLLDKVDLQGRRDEATS